MFSQIIGPVDFNAAAVLCVMAAAVCIMITTFIGKRRSGVELKMQFEVDKTKLHNEDAANKRASDLQLEIELAKIATERDVQFRRIETGLIEGKVNTGTFESDRR
jgi:hypothetical protein